MSTELFFFCLIWSETLDPALDSPPKYVHSPFVYTEMLMNLWSYY